MDRTDLAWWQRTPFLVALVILSAVPLLYPPVPPLTDLLGHIGRYAIQLDLASSPDLQRFYRFDWQLIGNLGVDLLVMPLAKLIGLEPAVKLIILCLPPLTVAGLLWIAREIHGRVPPTALFALPLAYGYPLHFGFVNFVLSMALALNAFALWLRLGRLGKTQLRAAIFIPISGIVWVAHVFGWGVLGLLAFSAELVRAHDGGQRWHRAAWKAGWAMLPLTPPIVLMLIWRSEDAAGVTTDFFNWAAKILFLTSTLRDWSISFDHWSIMLLLALLAAPLLRLRLRYDRVLGLGALLLVVTYVCLPRILIGSAYADMRLAPYMIAVALVAIRPERLQPRALSTIAAIALSFCAARIGMTTLHFVGLSRAYQQQLVALDHVPHGSRILVLVNLPCQRQWSYNRMDHLGTLAIPRRHAFVNGQWTMPGAQLLRVDYPPAGRFALDPTQQLRPPSCHRSPEAEIGDTIRNFPRAAFDFVWMIDRPRAGWVKDPGLVPVWNGRTGILYRVTGSATAASDTPNGSDRLATH